MRIEKLRRQQQEREMAMTLHFIFKRKRNKPRCWFCGRELLDRDDVPEEIRRRNANRPVPGMELVRKRERLVTGGIKSDELNPVVNVCTKCSYAHSNPAFKTLDDYRDYVQSESDEGYYRNAAKDLAYWLEKAGYQEQAALARTLEASILLPTVVFYGERNAPRESPEVYLRRRMKHSGKVLVQ